MTEPGWSEAFAKAEALRQAFDAIVADVRSGAIDLDAAHQRADADPLSGAVFAVKVYEAAPGIGKVKARRTLEALGLDEDVTLAAVPASTRVAVVARFAELKDQPLQLRGRAS